MLRAMLRVRTRSRVPCFVTAASAAILLLACTPLTVNRTMIVDTRENATSDEFVSFDSKESLPGFHVADGETEDASLNALVVFTMVRFDLLDLHLSSVDHPVQKTFVVLNYANENIKRSTLSVIDRYRNCGSPAVNSTTCKNPNIKELHVFASPNNLGFSGSVNVGIKAMISFDLADAIFSGDDTRFRPGRLARARQIFKENFDVCIFHFEGYSSFGLTKDGIKRIGPFDENFWPAYAEDCDYWYRSQLVGCRAYYRGGFAPDQIREASMSRAFVEHGDVLDASVMSSTTYKSSPELAGLVQGTLHGSRGRFSYLVRKWGFNTCEAYHNVINRWRLHDEVLDSASSEELAKRGGTFLLPYNDSVNFRDTRTWARDDWTLPGAISPRGVNFKAAPLSFVWQTIDYTSLDNLQPVRIS